MKQKAGLILAIALTLTILKLSDASFTGWVQAKPNPQESRGNVLHVTSSGVGTCTSWADACDLQAALTAAVTEDEIWVAAGTYLPTTTSDRTMSFQLKDGVAIYGGFSGAEVLRDQRNLGANPTILSGDIGVLDDSSDNSYHVVYGKRLTPTAILDGFTISYGNADGTAEVQYGGGIYNLDHSSPTLTNLYIFNNHARVRSGGLHNYNHSNPTMTNITFFGNSAAFGGAITNLVSSNPIMTNVTFSKNIAHHTGGAMINEESSSPTLINVTFYSNSAAMYGGGIYNYSSSPTLTNTILWSNTPDQILNEESSTPVITYSNIQDGYAGVGNINLDPLLAPLADNGGFTQTHALLTGSPAIDTGSLTICPATDQRGVSRPVDGDWDWAPGCDMGAYEYQPMIFYSYLPLLVR